MKRINDILGDRRGLLKLLDCASRIIAATAVVLFVMAILAQIMLQNDTIRHLLTSVDRWEGIRLN